MRSYLLFFAKEDKSSVPNFFFLVLQPFSTHFVASLLASSLSAAATVTPRLDLYLKKANFSDFFDNKFGEL